VPELNRKNVKHPASISLALVKLILRDKFHHAGVILADDVSADSMTAFQPAERAAVAALAAGCDAVLFLDSQPDRVRAVCAAIQDAVDKGGLAPDQLTESRKRLDAWQVRLARLDVKEAPPETTPVAQTPPPAETVAPKEPVPASPPEAAEVTPTPAPEGKAEVTEEGPAGATRAVETETNADLQPAPSEKPVEAAPAPPEQPPNTEKIIHEIKKGESLSKIAAKYGVKKEDIIAWNAMTDSVVKYGLKLTIYRPIAQPDAETKPVSEPAPLPVEQKTPEPGDTFREGVPKAGSVPPTPALQPPNTVKHEHAVSAGETLADIAGKYQVGMDDLKAWNELTSETLTPGQVLNVYAPPPPEPEKSAETTTHTVAKGENIYKIAAQYRTTVKKLIEMNKLETPGRLLAGQKLVVPKVASTP
jgi:LysM repeat protein